MSAVIFTGLISKKLMRRLREEGKKWGGRLGQKIRWTQTQKGSFDVWERERENRRERWEKLGEIKEEKIRWTLSRGQDTVEKGLRVMN